MVKNSNQSSGFLNIYTLGIFSVVSLIGIFVLTNTDNQSKIITNQDFSIYQNKQIYNQILSINIEQDFYNKIHELLVKESELDKDLYNRKLSKKTTNLFAQIAKYHGIDLKTQIDSEKFDFLYKELVKFQLELYKNNDLQKYSN